MFDLIIHNAKIIVCNSNQEVIDHGYISIKDGKIIEVGSSQSSSSKKIAKKFIDAKGNIIIAQFEATHPSTVPHAYFAHQFAYFCRKQKY